jgi:hypothetical protein
LRHSFGLSLFSVSYNSHIRKKNTMGSKKWALVHLKENKKKDIMKKRYIIHVVAFWPCLSVGLIWKPERRRNYVQRTKSAFHKEWN